MSLIQRPQTHSASRAWGSGGTHSEAREKLLVIPPVQTPGRTSRLSSVQTAETTKTLRTNNSFTGITWSIESLLTPLALHHLAQMFTTKQLQPACAMTHVVSGDEDVCSACKSPDFSEKWRGGPVQLPVSSPYMCFAPHCFGYSASAWGLKV